MRIVNRFQTYKCKTNNYMIVTIYISSYINGWVYQNYNTRDVYQWYHLKFFFFNLAIVFFILNISTFRKKLHINWPFYRTPVSLSNFKKSCCPHFLRCSKSISFSAVFRKAVYFTRREKDIKNPVHSNQCFRKNLLLFCIYYLFKNIWNFFDYSLFQCKIL